MSHAPPDPAPRDFGPTEIHPADASRISRPPASAPPLPEEAARVGPEARFDKFIRTRRIGSGGMGEVWRAWDTELGRWVALKFMREQEDPVEVGRFQREARLAGQLGHPNIAQVYETGTAQGRHYIAMPYIDGVTLLQFSRRDRRVVVTLMRDAAQAVDFAHRAGVVHRDIKPHNIMVSTVTRAGRKGSSSTAEHHAYVMDFGLARSTRRGADASQTGDVVGTPAYMPPEQARGERVGPAGDVYGLGATLYELLAGMPPVVAPTAAETLKRILEDEIRLPSVLDKTVDRELETIVMKCLEKEPRSRYRTAGELADDLGRWLAGEPILAHPPSAMYRLRKALARKRGAVVGLGIGLVLTASVLALAWPSIHFAHKGRQAAERERAAAERDRELWQRASTAFFEAELLSRAGERKAAANRLQAGLDECLSAIRESETARARYFLGRFRRLLGDTNAAQAELDRAISLDPGLSDARVERGLIRAADFAARVDQLLLDAPASWRASGNLWAQIHLLSPDLKGLRVEISGDLSADTGRISYLGRADAVFGHAELARASGEESEARRFLERVLYLDPAHVRAMVSLAKLELEEGLFDQADATATRAAERHRGDPEAFLLRARIFILRWEDDPDLSPSSGQISRWQDDALRAVALGASTAEAFAYRGDALRETGENESARAEYERALQARKGFAFALRGRGLLAGARGDHAAALRDLDAAVEALPGSPRTRLLLAGACVAAGSLDRAWSEFSKVLSEYPGILRARLGRAIVQEKRGAVDAAVAELNQAVERHPAAFLTRALLFERAGRVKEALADFNTAVRETQPGTQERAAALEGVARLSPR
ncbi:MAG: serine/threonine protein kinase [Planctomycetota bacterium]|nr:MAG: serine/threonine protein kinase [Planctomycetota bacterium]